jgi:hypothetical protein
MEVYESNVAVEILHQRRAALHPVAAIHIGHPAILLDLRPMNVPADNPLHVLLVRHLHDGVLEVTNVFHRGLGLVFEIGGDRPVTEAEAPAHAVEMQIEVQDPVVKARPDAIEQAVEVRDAVELMPV